MASPKELPQPPAPSALAVDRPARSERKPTPLRLVPGRAGERKLPTEPSLKAITALPPCLSRTVAPPTPHTAAAALDEALRHPKGGEVAVRSGEAVAVLHVHEGSIAWAHLSSRPVRMEDVLEAAGIVAEADLVATLKEESRVEGAHFMDLLVRWGLCSEEQARKAIATLVSRNVCAVLQLPDAIALFLPKVRPYHGRITVRPEELTAAGAPCLRLPLAPAAPATQVIPCDAAGAGANAPLLTGSIDALGVPPSDGGATSGPRSAGGQGVVPASMPASVPAAAVSSYLREAMEMDGALGVAAVELVTRRTVATLGEKIDPIVLETQVRSLAALGAEAEDVMAMTGPAAYLGRRIGAMPRVALFVSLDSSRTRPGLARTSLQKVVEPSKRG